MLCKGRLVRVTKVLLAGLTVVCVSWVASVSEWHGGVRWNSSPEPGRGLSTMRTIVAYSEGKQAEMERPSPLTCDRLPAFPQLPLINTTWDSDEQSAMQWQAVSGTRVSLYAAYYDERTPQHYVRILAFFRGRNFSSEIQLFCQTRPLNPYEDTIEVVAARPLEIWWHNWDTSSTDVDTPLLLSCPLTEALYVPSTVSIVTQPCDDPTNAFELKPTQGKHKYKRAFTICVKDMNFGTNIAQNLVEWIETNKILGVDMIDIYVGDISRASEAVLKFYRQQGYVRLFKVPVRFNLKRTLWQRRRDHIITYNDCLYRNIRESEFIIPLDIDEVIIPKVAYTWAQLIKRLAKQGWNPSTNSAILIQNAFFFDFLQNVTSDNKSKVYTKRDDVRIGDKKGDVDLVDSNDKISNQVLDYKDVIEPVWYKNCSSVLPEPKLARHVMRSVIVSPVGFYSKSFMVTKKVLTAFNHYPLNSIGSTGFLGWSAPFREVQLNHYKESCNDTVMLECEQYSQRARSDRTALRLKRRLTKALARTLCQINLT